MKPVAIIILAAVLCMNLVSFFLMLHDKRCARQNRRRVPEKTLFLVSGLFGAAGGTAAMWIFRHKTRHWYFSVFFPLMMLAQAAVLAYILVKTV